MRDDGQTLYFVHSRHLFAVEGLSVRMIFRVAPRSVMLSTSCSRVASQCLKVHPTDSVGCNRENIKTVCKYSYLHMSVKHDHEHERKALMMSRLQQHKPHQEGSALGHRVTLDSVAHRWVPARTPTVHLCPEKESRGWPDTSSTRRPPTNDNTTKTFLESNVLSATGVVIHLEPYTCSISVKALGPNCLVNA